MKKPIHCLIVEDEAISALSLEMELQHVGFNAVDIVASAELALRYIKNKKPDVVLMDLRLAGRMNGIEATRTISEKYHIPVIIITGYPDKQLSDSVKNLHHVRYLAKPLRTEVLLNEIELLLETSASE